ncbi:hypothetical protein ABKN59_004423 [Abortiporus biennis]
MHANRDANRNGTHTGPYPPEGCLPTGNLALSVYPCSSKTAKKPLTTPDIWGLPTQKKKDPFKLGYTKTLPFWIEYFTYDIRIRPRFLFESCDLINALQISKIKYFDVGVKRHQIRSVSLALWLFILFCRIPTTLPILGE